MFIRQYRYFAADFETTVYEGQKYTEVWFSGYCELFAPDDAIKLQHSFDDFWSGITKEKGNLMIYFHNLKFDGSFIIDWLFNHGYKWNRTEEKFMHSKEFKASISARGAFYNCIIKQGNRFIEFRDSLKLIPTSLAKMGKSFKTRHQKSSIEYTGYRYAGCPTTEEEDSYMKNDIYVLKEGLEMMFRQGHKEITIGSCCLKEFKSGYGKDDYDEFFPDLTKVDCPPECEAITADEYVRRSYSGGISYVNPRYVNKVIHWGRTYDYTSMYPSQMSSESGNYYPVGKPHWFYGNIPEVAYSEHHIFFVRFKARFHVKYNKMPFIRIRNNLMYDAHEFIETSDIKINGRYQRYYVHNGKRFEAKPILTMTCVDFKLFFDCYDVKDLEILDGCWFFSEIGLFDGYMDKYKKQKAESTGFLRELAKLYLNNLYGKEAASDDSSYKEPYLGEDGVVHFTTIEEHNKKPGYIPIGSMITSYARKALIEAINANFDAFIYCDTDSMHMLNVKAKNIRVHPTAYCAWKLEAIWEWGRFTRQKTYIEKTVFDGKQWLDEGEWKITAAGMNDYAKEMYLQLYESDFEKLEAFHVGMQIWGKLKQKRIPGGVILQEDYYTMKPLPKRKNINEILDILTAI